MLRPGSWALSLESVRNPIGTPSRTLSCKPQKLTQPHSKTLEGGTFLPTRRRFWCWLAKKAQHMFMALEREWKGGAITGCNENSFWGHGHSLCNLRQRQKQTNRHWCRSLGTLQCPLTSFCLLVMCLCSLGASVHNLKTTSWEWAGQKCWVTLRISAQSREVCIHVPAPWFLSGRVPRSLLHFLWVVEIIDDFCVWLSSGGF